MKLRNLIEQFKAERACYTKNEQSGFLSEISLEIIKANLTRRELIQIFGELAALGILVSPQNVEAFINLNLLRKKTTSGGSDSYWDQVVLSLHGDVSPLIDAKGHTLTINGSTARSTTTKKFGAGSIYFSGGDSIDLDGSNDFVFYTGDFTIEFWYLPQDISSTRILYDSRPDATQGLYPTIYHEATSLRFFTNSGDQIVGTTPLVLGSWHHISLCRSNGVTQLFLNGKPEGSSYIDTNNYLNGTSRVRFGTNGFNGFNGIVGYLDDIRVTKGVARYTSDFSNSGDAYWGNVVLAMQMDQGGLDWEGDAESANVALLLHMDGQNAGTTFFDVTGKTITLVGDVKTVTSTKKFGTASASFDGIGDALLIGAQSDWAFLQNGSTDYTIELWLYWNSGTADRTIASTGADPNQVGMALEVYGSSGRKLVLQYFAGNASAYRYESTLGVTNNSWCHIAVVFRVADSHVYFYIDGVQAGAGAPTITPTWTGFSASNPNYTLALGRYQWVTPGGYINGYMDDVRITKMMRYTSNFTPPNSALLGRRDLFIDLKNKTVTTVGNSHIDTGIKKFGVASAYFDGTGDSLVVTHSADLVMDSSDFTIECWIRPEAASLVGSEVQIFNKSGLAGSWYANYALMLASGTLKLLCSNNSGAPGTLVVQLFCPTTLVADTWYHIAVVKIGTSHKIYLNGVLDGSAVESATPVDARSGDLYIGHYNGGSNAQDFHGYIDDVRITKGIGRYTTNFTPPTSTLALADFPHTTFLLQNPDSGQPIDPNWNSVVLALHMDGLNNGTIFHDEKGKTVTVNGNAKTVTATKKFGMSSAYFDGTGDYLVVDGAGDFLFGTGDITIEFWLYLPSTNPLTLQIILDFRGSGLGEIFVKYDGGVIHLVSGQVTPLSHTNTGAVALESWYHVAFTLQSSVFSSYLNGVKSAASSIDSAAAFNPTNLVIGAVFGGGSYYLNGYIDDLRITKGVARYTANFSPPTRAFPRK